MELKAKLKGSLVWMMSMLLLSCTHHAEEKNITPPQNQAVLKPSTKTPIRLAKSQYGNPSHYSVNGTTYHVLTTTENYSKKGIASWYGKAFHGRLTSTRERYNMYDYTAASTELPIPTFVKVTNLANNKSLIVKVNDRGPFVKNRLIDLSYASAQYLDYIKQGTTPVLVEAIQFNDQYNDQGSQYIQIATFKKMNNAKKLKKDLATTFSNQELIIISNQAGHKESYKVLLGPLADHLVIQKNKSKLRQLGFRDTFTIIQ